PSGARDPYRIEVRRVSAEYVGPALQEPAQGLLDRLADMIGEVEHDGRIVRLRGEVLGRDRLADLDEPLTGQRYETQRVEQRERRGDRKVRYTEQASQRLDVADQWVDLLGSDDRYRDNRGLGAQCRRYEAAPAEPL